MNNATSTKSWKTSTFEGATGRTDFHMYVNMYCELDNRG